MHVSGLSCVVICNNLPCKLALFPFWQTSKMYPTKKDARWVLCAANGMQSEDFTSFLTLIKLIATRTNNKLEKKRKKTRKEKKTPAKQNDLIHTAKQSAFGKSFST